MEVEDIKEAFCLFYKGLFSLEDSPKSQEAREKCKEIIPSRITEEDSQSLKKTISVGEVKNAIRNHSNDKATGPDGLPVEFYKANEEWICQDLHELYTKAYENVSLGELINKGIIKLLPKEGDKSLIKNWRPITLLNVSYKILAKVLALRIENVLPKFIFPTQIGFIKGRFILENIITSWEVMD